MQACETTVGIVGPEMFQASVKTEEIARHLFPKLGAPTDLLRPEEEATDFGEEARQAVLGGAMAEEPAPEEQAPQPGYA